MSKNKPVLITTTTLIILVTWQNQTQRKASHQLRSSSVKTRKTGKEIFQIFAKREILPSPQHYKFPQNLLHISGLVSCRAISRHSLCFPSSGLLLSLWYDRRWLDVELSPEVLEALLPAPLVEDAEDAAGTLTVLQSPRAQRCEE